MIRTDFHIRDSDHQFQFDFMIPGFDDVYRVNGATSATDDAEGPHGPENRAREAHMAARIAAACRCPQELREFGYDPES